VPAGAVRGASRRPEHRIIHNILSVSRIAEQKEVLSFQRIFKKLYEDICSGTVSDRDEAVLAMQEHFTALTALTSSYRNIVE